jgi:hypothetical protein
MKILVKLRHNPKVQRGNALSDCNDIHNKVGNLRTTVTLIFAVAGIVLALTGYNIQQTQETWQEMIRSVGAMRTEIREEVAKIGVQLTYIEDRVIENRESLIDHERRLQGLEKRTQE